MSHNLSSEAVYFRLINLYESALRRTTLDQCLDNNGTPAEKVALQIADLSRRCLISGPDTHFNAERANIAIAGSHFLHRNFRVSSHWDELAGAVNETVLFRIMGREAKRNPLLTLAL